MRLMGRIVHAMLDAVLADVDYVTSDAVIHHDGPILFVANHIATTDSWCALDISDGLNRSATIIAQARVLTFFPFLRWIGFLPVSGADPMLVHKTFTQTATRALRPKLSAVWMFPQASHLPSTTAVGDFAKGVYWLMRLLPRSTLVVPVGIHYYVYRQPRAAVCVSVGCPIGVTADLIAQNCDSVIVRLEAAVQREVDVARDRAQVRARARIRYPFQPRSD